MKSKNFLFLAVVIVGTRLLEWTIWGYILTALGLFLLLVEAIRDR